MEIVFEKITKDTFDSLNANILFHDSTDRNYGKVFYKGTIFKFSWASDLVPPVIKKISDCKYGIGIDFNFSIVDFEQNTILINLIFDYYFLNFIVRKGYLYIANELEIIKLDSNTFKLMETYYLPEIYAGFLIKDSILEVNCLDGNKIIIEY